MESRIGEEGEEERGWVGEDASEAGGEGKKKNESKRRNLI
jgi:hypothetical protein